MHAETHAAVLERNVGVTLPGYLRMYELKFLKGEIKRPAGRKREGDPRFDRWEIARWRYYEILPDEQEKDRAAKAEEKAHAKTRKWAAKPIEGGHSHASSAKDRAAWRVMAEMRAAGLLKRILSTATFLSRIAEAAPFKKPRKPSKAIAVAPRRLKVPRPPSLVTRLDEQWDALMQSRQAKAA